MKYSYDCDTRGAVWRIAFNYNCGACNAWRAMRPMWIGYGYQSPILNGRANATVLRLSVCLWRYLLRLNGAC